MTATVQIVKGLTTANLPSDASFFDLYDGERLVAHLARPRVYAKDQRFTVTLYSDKREVLSTKPSHFPMAIARIHMKAMRRGLSAA